MFSRMLSAPVLLTAAVGVPYVATQGSAINELWQESSFSAAQPDAPPTAKAVPAAPPGPAGAVYPAVTPLEGVRSMSLAEIFRCDIRKEWVYHRWARKSTALAELGLYGIRVPLVSGTQLTDLAGSLTYYFDDQGRAQRISFRGQTGDTTQLVQLIAGRYGLQRQSTPVAGEQLFQIRREAAVLSELRTRPAPVLWANSPHESFLVELELQRPGSLTPLPARELLAGPAAPPPAAAAAQPTDPAAKPDPPEKSDAEKWKSFFPRSQVPPEQVKSLERRDRFW